MSKSYDFSGYASRYNVLCSDGRTIRNNAFKDMDGQEVTLTWGHDHSTPITVLGKAYIEHRDDGPYVYASFNDTPEAQHAKEAVRHGDVKYLSIWANKLKETAGNVTHGVIREVSLVYGGANPRAFIDHAVLAHGDGTYDLSEDEALIYMGGSVDELSHADEEKENTMADENKKPEEKKTEDDKTVEDVLNELNDEQLSVVAYLIDEAKKDGGDGEGEVKHSDYEGDDVMSYNAFEQNGTYDSVKAPAGANYISHADQKEILEMAKDGRVGTWKNAINIYASENGLMHGDTDMDANGFDTETVLYPTMSNNPADAYYTSFTAMLPEFKDVRAGKPPEMIDYDNSWVATVMNKVNKLPFSRIRTSQIDIRDAETRESFRAKGYQKGHRKTPSGNLKLARRTTDPQMVYSRWDLHREDIIDITEFDYVRYLYEINSKFFKEEMATAILFGDGRDDGDDDKIFPEHIRPIWTDDELYTRHIELDLATVTAQLQGTETDAYFGDAFILSEAMIQTLLYGREDHLGTGTPDLFITNHMMNQMLLARDRNGRRIYGNRGELATALNVGQVVTAKQFENRIRTDSETGKRYKMLAMLVNLADYSIGNTKGGEITHFTQFDIDFNKQKSLIEGRYSGALTRIQSAMVIEQEVDGNGTPVEPNP